ncbi:putative histidine protein methyltransferase [Monocercomonoides exilis]|uniref:putative histidine protein methyltransferase n=1 Tax=Monocercomonoides exilis TaxID=2049356 RepID=UPI003559C203|nr:putative histidine protein methyltransferase [Monocercomonoides exilis]
MSFHSFVLDNSTINFDVDEDCPIIEHSISKDKKLTRVVTNQKRLETLIPSKSPLHELIHKTDISPGSYEGGFTCWECSLDLCKYILTLDLKGKNVLEIGCGHGLPGITALLQGASSVTFQDYNEEVLRLATVPNIILNVMDKFDDSGDQPSKEVVDFIKTRCTFISGSWNSMLEIPIKSTHDFSSGACSSSCKPSRSFVSPSSSSTLPQELLPYDLILAAETVYRIDDFPTLRQLITHFLKPKTETEGDSASLFAGRAQYFGVGGGINAFRKFMTQSDEGQTLQKDIIDNCTKEVLKEEKETKIENTSRFSCEEVWISESLDHSIVKIQPFIQKTKSSL